MPYSIDNLITVNIKLERLNTVNMIKSKQIRALNEDCFQAKLTSGLNQDVSRQHITTGKKEYRSETVLPHIIFS